MIRAIFFDFNGVVIDDEALHMQAYLEVLKDEGVTFTEEEYYDSMGMDDKTFVRAIYERAGRQIADEPLLAIIERKTEEHRKLIEDELPFFHGILTFIKHTSRWYTLALVSMSRRVEIEYVLERARLQQLFKAVVSAEDVGACKPDPQCYSLALARVNEKRREAGELPLLPSECLVIEDAPRGIESGRAAGMRTLGVTNTVTESSLRAAGAEVVTHSLYDWNADAVYHIFSEGH